MRSVRLLAVLCAAVAVVGGAGGCSADGRASAGPGASPPVAAPTATARTATARTATASSATAAGRAASATAAPPPGPTVAVRPQPQPARRPVWPRPAPVAPLVSPAQPGEGAWRPAGDRLAGGYAIYTTELRPAAGFPSAGVAWIDSAASRLSLYAGYAEPYGAWARQAEVAPPAQAALMAAFNSGFKIYAYDTGWYDQRRTAVSLRDGAASFVIFANGTATVANWGRNVTLGPDVVAVRQNLTLLVDHGAPTPDVSVPGDWGLVLGGAVATWRSGVGVTSAGDLVYVGGPDLDPPALARLLVAAGAVRAMELDINPEWVSFAAFTHAGGIGGGGLTGDNLVAGMWFPPEHYLEPYSRDFFAVFARRAGR